MREGVPSFCTSCVDVMEYWAEMRGERIAEIEVERKAKEAAEREIWLEQVDAAKQREKFNKAMKKKGSFG